MAEQSQAFVKSIYPALFTGEQDPIFNSRPQVEFGYKFYNGLSVSVTVSLRTGARYLIPPTPGVRTKAFIIATDYLHSHDVIYDTSDLCNAEGQPTSPEAKAIEQALKISNHQPVMLGRKPTSASVKYALSKKDFDKVGGQLYLQNLDVLLSIYNLERSSFHPGTINGQCNDFLNDDPVLKDLVGFSYSIQIVDRHRTYGDRYVNVCGKVFRVSVSSDPNKLEGVFIRHTGESAGLDVLFDIPEAKYYTFEEADKIEWLYKTHTEALTLGDTEAAMQRELIQRKHHLQELEMKAKAEDLERRREFEAEKRAFEREREDIRREELIRNQRIADREYQLKSLEIEYAHRDKVWKMDKEMREAAQEMAMAAHKNRLEWIKTIPVIIGVVGAGIALYKQLSK